jgi:sugar phosphate permease
MQDSTPEPSLKRWRINVVTVTWLSYAGYYFCRKAFGIVKPDLKTDYSFTDMELAHIWTAFLVCYMLGQFMSATLGRKFSCRILLLTGMMTSLLVNIGLGFSTLASHDKAFYAMVVLMVINGFAQATGWPGNVGLLAKWSRKTERGRLMAIWGTCYQIGSILAKHFAALMLALLGLAWSFWGAAIVLLVVWTLFYFLGKERPEDVGLPAIAEEVTLTAEEAERTKEMPWERAIKIVIFMGMIYFCFKFLRYALDSWAPMLIKETFSKETATAGHLSTVFDWVGFLGVIAGGFASDKLFKSKRTPVIFLMSVGMCVSVGLWMLFGTTNLVVYIALIGCIGFMLMGPDSLLSGTAAMDVSSKEKAVIAAGIINGLGSIGPIVQEQAIGYLRTNSGIGSVYVLLFAISVLAVVGTGGLFIFSKKNNFGV